MTREFARADFFDASALVCVFAAEPLSQKIATYFHTRTTKYTTPYCFYEALNVLKGKWKYKRQLTQAAYLSAARELANWYGASSRGIRDLDFTDHTVFTNAEQLAARYDLDLSDSFQIVSIKHGYFSRLCRESATVLVTADQGLALAARSEDLRVWNACTEPAPE